MFTIVAQAVELWTKRTSYQNFEMFVTSGFLEENGKFAIAQSKI